MLMIVGTLRIPVENVAAARTALAGVVEATRKEDGCLEFSFAESVAEPGQFYLIERWTDRAALEAHWQSPALKAFRPTAEQLGVGDRNMFLYEIALQTKL
jgi:quinol monooxygenase YgiN